jgi:hypothetical protein
MASLLSLHPKMDNIKTNSMGRFSALTKVNRYSILLGILLVFGTGFQAVGNNSKFSSKGFFHSGVHDESCNPMDKLQPYLADPNITVRLSNPQFNCTTAKYCADVEFQSDLSNQELYAMNVRFWYDENVLELVNFTGFQGGYGVINPNPPGRNTFTFGPSYFNFAGPAEYINGAIQKVNANAPAIVISTTGWTKLFQVCFTVDDPNANYNNFCPSVVLDLEQNPANGGYLPGSDGVVMTVILATGGSGPVVEHVNQFNWQYIGSGNMPYGQPISNACMSTVCAPWIACPANISINCGASTLPANTGLATSTDFCPGNPSILYTDAVSGGPCPQANVITRTWTANDACGSGSTCQQTITVGPPIVNLVVTNTNDSGTGSLRDAIALANPQDTIVFASSLAGLTISITSTKLAVGKSIFIRSYLSPRIKINSTIPGLFDIGTGYAVEFKNLDITSGLQTTNNDGAAFNNLGALKLVGVNIFKNPNLPAGQYLIRNKPSSSLILVGNSVIHYP